MTTVTVTPSQLTELIFGIKLMIKVVNRRIDLCRP